MSWDQIPLFDPHTRVRPGDPDTSHEAAESLDRGYIRDSQNAVLDLLRMRGPMTHADLVAAYAEERAHLVSPERAWWLPAQSESGLRTRCSELVAAGLVKDTGRRSRLPSGRKSILWGIAP